MHRMKLVAMKLALYLVVMTEIGCHGFTQSTALKNIHTTGWLAYNTEPQVVSHDCLMRSTLNICNAYVFPTSLLSTKGGSSKADDDVVPTLLVEKSNFTTPFDRPALAFLDLVTLVLFAAIGTLSHTNSESFTLEIQKVILTALPFVVSWFLTSTVTGVYNPLERRNNRVKSSVSQTAKGWIIAIPIGCVLRGIVKGYMPPIPFVAVTMISTLVLLCISRIIYAILDSK